MLTLKQLAPNVTLLCWSEKQILFSYETAVGAFVSGRGYLVSTTYYSPTTSRHISKWLDGARSAAVTQEEIDALCV